MNADPLRVLVVDDEPAILRFLRAGLAAQGFTVSEAPTGRAALDKIKLGAADLAVLGSWLTGHGRARRDPERCGPPGRRSRSSCCPAATTKAAK